MTPSRASCFGPVRQGVTLIGGGVVDPELVARAWAVAPVVVAADGGADQALALGITPEVVIGDMDSISDAGRAALSGRMISVAEQNSTDFEKCLCRIAAPFVVAVGFDGGRLDHSLAAISVLARRVGPPVVMLCAQDVVFAPPPRLHLDLAAGTRVSIFPMGPLRGHSRGLRWPIDGLTLTPGGMIGTSNEALGAVDLDLEGQGVVLLPVTTFEYVMAACFGHIG